MKGVVLEAVKYDSNGIEIQFLNNRDSRNIKVRSCYREALKVVA